jgi:hypothetical protein
MTPLSGGTTSIGNYNVSVLALELITADLSLLLLAPNSMTLVFGSQKYDLLYIHYHLPLADV